LKNVEYPLLIFQQGREKKERREKALGTDLSYVRFYFVYFPPLQFLGEILKGLGQTFVCVCEYKGDRVIRLVEDIVPLRGGRFE